MTPTINLHNIPLYKFKKKMKELQLEIELLEKDPAASHNEIAERDAELSELKLEYARRKLKLMKARNGKEDAI